MNEEYLEYQNDVMKKQIQQKEEKIKELEDRINDAHESVEQLKIDDKLKGMETVVEVQRLKKEIEQQNVVIDEYEQRLAASKKLEGRNN